MTDITPDEVAARLYSRLGSRTDAPAQLGYAVIETDAEGNNPSYCVHGPDPVDTAYEDARAQWTYLTRDAYPGRRYILCKLVPVEGEAP